MKYKFEINDLRCVLTLLNIFLILKFDFRWAWFSVILAGFGIIKDLTTEFRLNSLIMHVANLFFYFFLIMY